MMISRLLLTATALAAVAWAPPSVEAQNLRFASTEASSQENIASSAVLSLERSARVELDGVTVAEALVALRDGAGVRILFSPSLLPAEPTVTCDCADATIEEALERILEGSGFRFTEVRGQVVIEREPERTLPAAAGVAWFPIMRPLPDEASTNERPGRSSGETRAAVVRVGTITGRVTNARTLAPIRGAQVVVVGENIGSLTDGEGRYTIPNVPAGEHTVRTQMVGFGAGEQTVLVEDDQTHTVDFELTERAVDLEEIIVTGTAGETRRRAIGTSVASINIEERLQDAPISNMGDLLSAREPGMASMTGGGLAGTGADIQLRGMTSLSQANRPIIYIDGVRMDDTHEGLIYLGGQKTGRLNDINPQDISRIEVIKGAAATTLYGSEASNGVIQIFTKRGRTGEMTLNASTRLGINDMPRRIYRPHYDTDTYLDPNEELISPGLYQEYNASARGGLERVTYFASASFQDSEGAFVNNHFSRASGRLNLGIALGDWTADLSSSMTWSDFSAPRNDNVTSGVLTAIHAGNPVTSATEDDPWGGAFFPVPYNLMREHTEEYFRWSGGITLSHDLGPSFQHRLTVGADLANGEGVEFNPYAQGQFPSFTGLLLGSRAVQRRTNVQANFDYAATWTTNITSSVQSALSVGGQLFTTDERRVTSTGNDFPSPGLRVVGAAGRSSVNETEISYATGGLFVQEEVSFNDRLFVTGGLRVDGSSVFGEDFGLQAYPKLALSYVIGEEEWFNLPGFSSLRLRGGWGRAGTQPGAFDALRTWSPVTTAGGITGFHSDNPGNPELAPEVSSEIELGADAGFRDEMITLSVTAYHQSTTDALVTMESAPSSGFVGNQYANVGEVRNRGLELGLDWVMVDRSGLRWTANFGYSYNDNEVVALGGDLPFISLDRFGTRIVEGYPIGSKWERVIVDREADGTPIFSDESVHLGNGIPPHTGHVSSEVQWRNLRFSGTGGWATGYVMSNLIVPYTYGRGTGEHYFRDLDAAGGEETREIEIKRAMAQNAVGEFYEDTHFFRIRELTVSYSAPTEFMGGFLGASPRFFVSARNPFLLTNYSGTDPEISSSDGAYGSDGFSVSSDFFSVPQSRQFIFGVDVTF